MNQMYSKAQGAGSTRPARLGFLGVGWIGRHRMTAILESGAGIASVIADPSSQMVEEARRLAPESAIASDLDELLRHDLDGVVIATPSAQHAEQSIRGLKAGVAVFCQKPLGRTAEEVKAVVDAAKAADRLLGVDLSYRETAAMKRIRDIIRSGELGTVFAADLVFHNAYGPDKPWFYDKALSGGGCVMDLGVHLIDLALWALDFPEVVNVSSHLMGAGKRLAAGSQQVEDYGVASLELASGAVIRISCSWKLQAGCDAIIGASFFGTLGGVGMHNVAGSFYDFRAERFHGTAREALVEPPDGWGGRAAAAWAAQLAQGAGYSDECETFTSTASIMDRVYGRSA